MPSTTRDTLMAWLAFAAALLVIVATVLLILTFSTELPFNGPFVFGAGFEVVTAVGNVLTAALVLHLSRLASSSPGARVWTLVLCAFLVCTAILALLVAAQVIDYPFSVAATVVVLVLAGIWMIWVNRRFRSEGILPIFVGTFGWLIGLALVSGLPLAALGLVLPELTIAQLLALGFGVFLAGGAWVVWSVWWVCVGVSLLRGVRGGRDDEGQSPARRRRNASLASAPGTRPASGTTPASGIAAGSAPDSATGTDAPVKLRGRRKA